MIGNHVSHNCVDRYNDVKEYEEVMIEALNIIERVVVFR